MRIRKSRLQFATNFSPVPCSYFVIPAQRRPRSYLSFGLCLSPFKPSNSFLTRSTPFTVTRKLSTKNTALAPASKMSYSNTDTGDKTADPYKAKNIDQPSLKEKVEGLSTFISNSKFGMLTTRIEGSKLLTSRAMSVAAQVCLYFPRTHTSSNPPTSHIDSLSRLTPPLQLFLGNWRHRSHLPHQHRVRQDGRHRR